MGIAGPIAQSVVRHFDQEKTELPCQGVTSEAQQHDPYVKAQAGTAELTEASVHRYTEQYSPNPVDKVDDV